MITKLLLEIFLYVPNLLLESLPSFEVAIPDGVFDGLRTLFAVIGWFPLAQLLPILGVSIALSSARMVWARVIRIKSFIPTMGA